MLVETGQLYVTSVACTLTIQFSRFCFVAERIFIFLFFRFNYFEVDSRWRPHDTTTDCTRHIWEHVSAINNNIMSYMVLYYYNYRNRAVFNFISKIEMRLLVYLSVVHTYLVIMDRPRGVHTYSKRIASVICV